MNEKTILITGANGFTGRHACCFFSEKGYKVVGLVRNYSDKESSINYQEFECDLSDERAIEEVVTVVQPDYVLHAAGKNDVKESWENPREYVKVNVLATVYLLEAIRKLNKKVRVLVIGSALEYNPQNSPNHPYGLTKTFQSLIAKSWKNLFQLPVIIAKPTNLIGPGPSKGFCALLAQKISGLEKGNKVELIKVDDPNQRRDFLNIRDAISAYEKLLLHGEIGEVYPIGTGDYRTLTEVINTYQELTDLPVPVQYGKRFTQKSGRPVTNEMDLSKMNELNWHPKHNFRESLEEILTYYRNKE